ncbi:enoyl-[acyl-carrier-protein] reductase [NADH] 1-like [Rhinoderma darwinii]|uniref:enoyl-[acyl-carrier-protein] reductase [NADH] 1-like n=1 Tax=Rhinoderma darwinii TaxID=43563 RepID=UPI003F664A74
MANHILKGKKGIIFGALDEKSIAWKTAQQCYAEGAEIILTNAPIALRMGAINQLAKACGDAPVIGADVTSSEDIEKLLQQSMEHFNGKIDFILHSVGMSLNIRKAHHYTDLNYEFQHKTFDISAMSLHRVLQAAYKKDALNEWGSVVALTYIAAQRVFPDYNEMADAKALLESISRSFGYHYGVKKKGELYRPNQTKVDAVNDAWDKFDSKEVYDIFSEQWLKECHRVLKPTGMTDVWDETLQYLAEWKKEIPDLPEINFDIEAEQTFEEIKDLKPLVYRKIFENEELFQQIVLTIFPEKKVLKLLLNYFESKETSIYKTLSEKLKILIV